MMSDKKDPVDSNEALVKSLESIKALLAQSETKLSAARESLTQANKGPSMKKQSPDNDIPTLEEIVEAGQQIQIDLAEEEDIPVLESIEMEAPVFNLHDDEDLEEEEATMTIDTSSMPFEMLDDDEDDTEAIPVLEMETTTETLSTAESEPMEEPAQEVATVSHELPDLSPLLRTIDDVEGMMRAQISEAAIAFEEKLSSQLDIQMQKLREQVYLLVDKFSE